MLVKRLRAAASALGCPNAGVACTTVLGRVQGFQRSYITERPKGCPRQRLRGFFRSHSVAFRCFFSMGLCRSMESRIGFQLRVGGEQKVFGWGKETRSETACSRRLSAGSQGEI